MFQFVRKKTHLICNILFFLSVVNVMTTLTNAEIVVQQPPAPPQQPLPPSPPVPQPQTITIQDISGSKTQTISAVSSSIYNTEPQNGDSYLMAVMKATASLKHNEVLAAFTVAALVPTKSESDYAVVCLQNISGKIFRSHSQNPSAIGILTSPVDIQSFNALIKLERGTTFNYSVPSSTAGNEPAMQYKGQIFLKNGDGQVSADCVCFARYHQ